MTKNTAVRQRFDLNTAKLQRVSHDLKSRRIQFVSPRAASKSDPDGFDTPSTFLVDPHDVRAMFGWKTPEPHGAGLKNCGNTCYLNSVLQALTHSSPIANDALTDSHFSGCHRRKANMFCGYCQLLKHVKSALTCRGRYSIAPESILRQLKLIAKNMRLGRQEDSHEFLRQLIDSCVMGELPLILTSNPKSPLVPASTRATTAVGQLFSGYLQSQVICGSCQNVSRTFDPYMDISLEIQDCSSLDDCLRRFTRADTLAGPNAYRCSKCEKRVTAKKQMLVHKCPPLLTIQLKRFHLLNSAQKVNKKVKFDAILDMAPFMSSHNSSRVEPLKYSLYAVIVHEGSSMSSGHYVCYAKAGNGAWYLFNDSQVQQVSEQTVLNQSAYILMYESRDSRCFYASDNSDFERTPVKSPSSDEITVNTPTCQGSSSIKVINQENFEEEESSTEDSVQEESAEDGLEATMNQLNKKGKASALATYIQKMRRAVVREPERKVLRMLNAMRVIAKINRKKSEPVVVPREMEAASATEPVGSCGSSKWGSIEVKTWGEGDDIVKSASFKSIVDEQTNAPEPGSRSQYDLEYDLGKSKHNPRPENAAGKGIPESLATDFNAIARGDMMRRPIGKGKGKGRSFGKGKGKGRSFGKGKGKGRSFGKGKGKGRREF
jgi:ubiquitin C-terminal hydrolase